MEVLCFGPRKIHFTSSDKKRRLFAEGRGFYFDKFVFAGHVKRQNVVTEPVALGFCNMFNSIG
jgi:hypothetical protein